MGFVPSENLQHIMRNAQPIVSTMSRELKMEVVPFVATDYTGVIEAMRAKKLDVAFFAPGAYVLAERQAKARAILKAVRGGDGFFYSAIITRSDSSIKSLRDLKGKTFAFVDPVSVSGAIYPKALLLEEGLRPERDFSQVIYAGGHDATVLAVLHGKVDAGATFANSTDGKQGSWHGFLPPEQHDKIRVLAYTKPAPSDNIAVAEGLDPQIVSKITSALLKMSSTPEGRKNLMDIYHIEGFAPTTPAEYAPIRDAFNRVGHRLP
jgi:phosphonate transport system substrate-binding protein